MRFMMIIKAPTTLEQSTPDPTEFDAMGRFNGELVRAGVLRELNGLKPTSTGAKIKCHGAERTVIDGPFTEAKELIAGYWIIEVPSLEDAVAWAKRTPFSSEVHRGQAIEIEVRPLMEYEDLPPERAAAKQAFEQREQ